MTPRTATRRRASPHSALDEAIARARTSAIVVWQGEHLWLDDVPQRIARISARGGRELLYGSWVDALEALNPLYAQRLAAWSESGEPDDTAIADAGELLAALGPFAGELETPYYAALRRYLALIGIEQGDASEADAWYVLRGAQWSPWFGAREVARALEATGRGPLSAAQTDAAGWYVAERALAGDGDVAQGVVTAAIGRAYASLVGSPDWLTRELGVDADDVGEFVDFAALARLWRIRRCLALLTYELRLYANDDPALQRAYYAGIVGHQLGVAIAEAGYLAAVPAPFASAAELCAEILGGMLAERLEADHGPAWWREREAVARVRQVGEIQRYPDALAQLGYDGADPTPVLRQIRSRLIGELSGYGGPNITTRAGSRKV